MSNRLNKLVDPFTLADGDYVLFVQKVVSGVCLSAFGLLQIVLFFFVCRNR